MAEMPLSVLYRQCVDRNIVQLLEGMREKAELMQEGGGWCSAVTEVVRREYVVPRGRLLTGKVSSPLMEGDTSQLVQVIDDHGLFSCVFLEHHVFPPFHNSSSKRFLILGCCFFLLHLTQLVCAVRIYCLISASHLRCLRVPLAVSSRQNCILLRARSK